MNKIKVNFKNTRVPQKIGDRIVSAIEQEIGRYPNKSIKAQAIAENYYFNPNTVVDVLSLLRYRGDIKAMVLPRCKECGAAVGEQETSTQAIIDKVDNGDINFCHKCNTEIEKPRDISMEILFWKLGMKTE
jgi:hypothetical protein